MTKLTDLAYTKAEMKEEAKEMAEGKSIMSKYGS